VATFAEKVIRFTNDDIRYSVNAVVARILEEVEIRIKELDTRN